MNLKLELGKISEYLNVDDYILRKSDEQNKVQGHITNKSKYDLDDLCFDVSFYDNDNFLGLEKSTFLDIEEISRNQTLPFDLDIEIPQKTNKIILNVFANKMVSGLLMRLFYK